MAKKINVILVEDHELFRSSVKQSLAEDQAIRVVGEAADSAAAIELIGRLKPDVVLLDLRLATGTGMEVARAIRDTAPDCKPVVLTAHDDERYIRSLARLGVSGYLLKTASADEIKRAVHDAAEGRIFFPSAVARAVTNTLRDSREIYDRTPSLREMKDSFVRAVSNELRTPLTLIQGGWQLIAEGYVKPGDEEFIKVRRQIDQGLARFNGLISDLEALERLEAGLVELRRAPFQLSDLLDELAAQLQPVLSAKRQTIEIVVPRPAGVISADRSWLQLGVRAAAASASHLGSAGAVLKLVGAIRGGRAIITLTQPGIPVSQGWENPAAPGAAYQVSRSDRIGLGLSLCWHVVDLHRGTMHIGGQEGAGTQLTIDLPADPQQRH